MGCIKVRPCTFRTAIFPFRGLQHETALPGCSERIVDWTKQTRFRRDIGGRIALIPDVIAGSDHSDATSEQINGYFASDASAAGGVFSVDNHEIHTPLLEVNRD